MPRIGRLGRNVNFNFDLEKSGIHKTFYDILKKILKDISHDPFRDRADRQTDGRKDRQMDGDSQMEG
jgi:hypothetical protein